MSLLRRSRLLINPAHADLLRRAGLREAHHFLELREEIVSGHSSRQASRVRIGDGPDALAAYLKREHRVPWLERLRNLWAGFGLASKSWREIRLLSELPSRFEGCPEWIAAGELPDGQAFALVREVAGAVPLTQFLEQQHGNLSLRRRLACELGAALARLHAAGMVHGDLYANHVLVIPDEMRIVFLDWQRAGPGLERWRDLAALAATLPPGWATKTEQFACLKAYLGDSPVSLAGSAREILNEVRLLRRRRHVRAKTSAADAPALSLLCLDGDALRVTPAFRQLWPGPLPSFLSGTKEECREVPLPNGGRGLLVRRCHRLPLSQRHGAGRRTWTSPERLQMNLLNRLQRFGVEAPRVLAAGEVALADGRVAAFLLTRQPENATSLEEWLAQPHDSAARTEVLRGAGTLLARLHQAGCFFAREAAGLAVGRTVVLTSAAGLTVRRRLRAFWRGRDLRRLCRLAGGPRERACILQSYWKSSSVREAY